MLQQTLKFVLSDKLSHSQAVEYSSKEADDYVHQLEKSGLKFSILSRKTDSDEQPSSKSRSNIIPLQQVIISD